MNGIEISRAFYKAHGEKMLQEKFPHLLDKIAVGVAGGGSDSFGFDDEVSRDHDYEAGFIVFLPGEDVVSRRDEFLLERAYNALPNEFMGVKRPKMSPVGGNRRGIMRYADFFEQKTGFSDGALTTEAWLRIPENYLFEATSGEIFFDGYGEVTRIRKSLSDMPKDARLKRLTGNLLSAGQSGQYNYTRCVKRGEGGAAQLALYEFVKSAINCVFLLENAYCPYYKWSFYAMRRLALGASVAADLETLICSDNCAGNYEIKTRKIERICALLTSKTCELIGKPCGTELERLAYLVNDCIENATVRNLDVFYCV
ncbi:MAG: DUF4037 domain-containing protein [Candidatus Neoclostridium sp.]